MAEKELEINSTADFLKFCEEVENSKTINKLVSYIKEYETNNAFISFRNGNIGTEEYISILKRNEAIIGFLKSFSIAKNRIIEDLEREKQEEESK